MATQRTSSNILWSTMATLVAGEYVTKEYLYTQGLHRLQDYGGALLGRIAKVYSDLTSSASGTRARIVGNVDMTAFNYDSGIALNGLTVKVDEDTTTEQTVTFGNTITGPAQLLAALTAGAPTNLVWSLNDSGYLVVESQTYGPGSTIALGTGTAHSLIWPSPTITSPGASTVIDGASRIGVAAFGPWAGGTLRNLLIDIYTVANNAVIRAGDTMTGDLQTTRIGVGYVDLGVLTNAGHVTIAADVGIVKFKTPATNNAYLTITLPLPSNVAARPCINFRMLGNPTHPSQVYFVAAAEAGTGSFGLPPTNYYGFFAGGANNNGHIHFMWNGTKWEIVLSEGNDVAQSGGGTYA